MTVARAGRMFRLGSGAATAGPGREVAMRVAAVPRTKVRGMVAVPADPCVATAMRRLDPAGTGAPVVSEDGEDKDGPLSGRNIHTAGH